MIGGSISIGNRLPDGRATRWVDGGYPIGVADDRHHLLVAGSRAGKGRSVLVPNLIMLPKETSTLVIDLKGDLAKATCRWRAEGLGQDVAVIDPFECSAEGTRKYRVGFNPIEMLSRSDRFSFVPNALLIASSLIPDSQRSKDPHWNDCARDILSGLCTHVATQARYEGRRNLVTVWELAFRLAEPSKDDPNSYTLEIEMMDNDAGGGTVRASARAFYDRTG
ncbi:type IV secretory system conjugative DNA transfer family protein [Rhodopirellula bahusiensis]|uniref:type IV secretory system conjugative DNA transfer family protein n=1 Tax=Rhodopirellula bahusiensis TaxID=2014065 RepID=UPI003264D9ED